MPSIIGFLDAVVDPGPNPRHRVCDRELNISGIRFSDAALITVRGDHRNQLINHTLLFQREVELPKGRRLQLHIIRRLRHLHITKSID